MHEDRDTLVKQSQHAAIYLIAVTALLEYLDLFARFLLAMFDTLFFVNLTVMLQENLFYYKYIGFENSLWYLIKFFSTEVLLVGVIYRAPSSSNKNNQNYYHL